VFFLPFAIVVGFAVGGNFGGGYGELLAGKVGVIFGLMFGITITAGSVLLLGSILGATAGKALEFLIESRRK
jgi:hypothetical protein